MSNVNPVSSFKTFFSNLALSSAMTTLHERVSNFASGVISSIGALFRNAATSVKNFIWRNQASNRSQPITEKKGGVESDSEMSTTSSSAHSKVQSSDSEAESSDCEADNHEPVDTGRGQAPVAFSGLTQENEESDQ